MASERSVQTFIHSLEEGRWASRIRLAALLVACLAAVAILVFDPLYWGLFKGLSHSKGMEQAQIAREVARGNGFSTKMIRPLALAQLQLKGKPITPDSFPDTYQAPLWPATLAPFLLAIKSKWTMAPTTMIYHGDKVIMVVAILLFYLSVVVNFFTVRRLFDLKLAWLTAGMMLLCDTFWNFAMSGLPQMEMLFLFSVGTYVMIRAVENGIANKRATLWLAATAAIFGLLALTHAITIWLFLGALVFCIVYFQPRLLTAGVMIAVFLAIYSPWLIRNYRVSGNPVGISWYSIFNTVRGSETAMMRDYTVPPFAAASPRVFRSKVQSSIAAQIADLVRYLGGTLVAPLFFVALLNLFKRREVRIIRWLLLSMWFFAVMGMALFGLNEEQGGLSSNNLHLLFIPLFLAYGFAFLFVLWNRLEINVAILRYSFIILIFVLSAFPFINRLTVADKRPFLWPPYAPPYVALLNLWTHDKEVIASDMPWAVAWYADRESLWLPMALPSFIKIHDYDELKAPIAGIYLTPVSGDRDLLSSILKGEYKDWAPFILRSTNLKGFPFPVMLPLPIQNQSVFYSDRVRWNPKTGAGVEEPDMGHPKEEKPAGESEAKPEAEPQAPATQTP